MLGVWTCVFVLVHQFSERVVRCDVFLWVVFLSGNYTSNKAYIPIKINQKRATYYAYTL